MTPIISKQDSEKEFEKWEHIALSSEEDDGLDYIRIHHAREGWDAAIDFCNKQIEERRCRNCKYLYMSKMFDGHQPYCFKEYQNTHDADCTKLDFGCIYFEQTELAKSNAKEGVGVKNE